MRVGVGESRNAGERFQFADGGDPRADMRTVPGFPFFGFEDKVNVDQPQVIDHSVKGIFTNGIAGAFLLEHFQYSFQCSDFIRGSGVRLGKNGLQVVYLFCFKSLFLSGLDQRLVGSDNADIPLGACYDVLRCMSEFPKVDCVNDRHPNQREQMKAGKVADMEEEMIEEPAQCKAG